RHEEIRGGDHAVFVVQLPDGGIVAGFRANQKLAERLHDRLVRQQVLQNGWSELAAAAAAMGERAETNRRCNIHDTLGIIWLSRARSSRSGNCPHRGSPTGHLRLRPADT